MFWDSFIAFNVNAANNLAYTFINNFWFFVMVIAAIVITIMSVRSAIDMTVTDEQNIL